MHFLDLADGAGLNPFAGQAQALAGVAVVAHLRDQPGFLRHASHHPRLFDGVRHRFLDIDVLARAQCRERNRRVHVVGRADDHGVAALEFFQHDAVIGEALRVRESLDRAGGVLPIHVAQRDDVLAGDGRVAQHPAALISDANAGDVQLLARWRLPLPPNMTGNNPEAQPRDGRAPQEEPSGNGSVSLFAEVFVRIHGCVFSNGIRGVRIGLK